MTKPTKWGPLVLLGMTLLAMIVLSAGLSGFEPQPGGPFPFWLFNRLAGSGEPSGAAMPPPSSWSINIWQGLGIIGGFIAVAWVIVFILHPEARKRMLLRLAVYLTLFALIYLVYINVQTPKPKPRSDGEPSIAPKASLVYTEPPATPEFINEPPSWLAAVITVGVIALTLGLVWWWWQRRPRPILREDPLALLALHARQAVDTLQAGSDLKDTVLRCYYDMSQVLRNQRGLERQQGMTPREFEQYLTDLGLRDDHIRRLTRLFESVRYGAAIASEREKREAIDCLNAIVRLCGRSV